MDIEKRAIPDVKEALNEYFKLKLKYETQNMANKKKIMNNPTLSNREKRSEYLKLKPKCINCKRPGGSRFRTTYFKETDKLDAYREYSAMCGIIADPCNLNIKIQIGKVDLLPNLLNQIQKEIKDIKNEVIDDKNKLLFGYTTAEEVLKNFDELKDNIGVYTSLYESYLENYNNIVDNDKKKEELNESITNSYIQIGELKDCIKKMNDTNNIQYAHDAVSIYINVLTPLLNKIRVLKYNETMVSRDADLNTCNLIQNKYSIQNLSYSSFQDRVVSYNVGFEVGKKKKPALIVESSESDQKIMSEPLNPLKKPLQPKPIGEIPQDEPIYGQGKDGIAWSIPEYNKLWNSLPSKIKAILRQNNQWMKDFMFNCINAREKGEACKFIEPSELKIPPTKMPNGNYDFGVAIYNEEFQKLPKSVQETYLTLYSEKEGVKNYNMLKDTMNNLVAKTLDFNKGYF
jgi:hypothetical protein